MTDKRYDYGYDGDYSNDYSNEFEDEFEDDQRINPSYINRRLQKNKMERKIRQTQMWLARLRAIVRLCVIMLLIFVGYKSLKLSQWYLDKNIFNSLNNPRLEIMNNKIVPSYKVLSALRRTDVPNIPIYRLDTEDMKKNIMQLDPVDDVFIRRFWFPARLQIIIEEKVPVLTISPAENVAPIAFFTRGGKLIGRDYMPLDKSFKTTLVLSYGVRGDDYRSWNNDKVKLLENIGKAVKTNSNEDVLFIDYRNPKDVYVRIKTVNIRLGLVDDTVFERIKRLPSILPQIKMLDKPIKYIDLRWKNTNYIKLG